MSDRDVDDDHDWVEDDEEDGQDCGRWYDGKLNYQCLKAGSEECDWHCPIGLPTRRRRK
jgi:hypothetical protein